ncbi:hypothetical protein R3P38DRAFT_3202741 [Favolaschia claudopus]|uniref:Uncharacterized protein n=1 Tax=Favolaschia claudopus TaxID=2862362 RepID=A0AAW0ATW8_9AGAR
MAELGLGAKDVDIPSPEETRRMLREEYERLLIEAYRNSHFEEDGGGEEIPEVDMLKDTGCNKDDDDDPIEEDDFCDSEYFPYPSKAAMLLDVIDNLPRCRFSSAQMTLMIHFAQQLGVQNVPSYKGKIFYMNDIRDTLARDLANPLIAPHLHFFPELMEYTPQQLTPMFSKGHKRFWIEEVARCGDGRFVIPHEARQLW